MVPWILFAVLPISAIPVFATVDQTYGVPPNLLSSYVPLKGGATPTWKCLDGSKEIPWSAVNDDYCDCPDGSDEPGTGACPNTRFYCRNEGHVGMFVPSSRVNDGLCEPECCDGSDERAGVCKNTCKEIGEVYRAKQEAERKLRKTGSKIRASYIAFAQKEKKRLEAAIIAGDEAIASQQREVDRLKDLVERTESLSAAELEKKKQSPLYQNLIKHHQALKSLNREHKEHLERERALGDILNALRTGYNPNYQDMAVLEAVRGWEHFAGLPHINDVKKDEEVSDESEEGSDDLQGEEEEVDESWWTKEQLDRDLLPLLSTNFESLLLEHEKHIGTSATESLLFDLKAYLPDALVPQYETFTKGLVSWLRTLGVVSGTPTSASVDASHLKEALSSAERALGTAKQDAGKARSDLTRLFDPAWFGKEGEFKKLEGTCLEKDTGDYTYELCLFGEAKQKPNKGGSNVGLGHFDSWNKRDGIEEGSPEYYSKQFYTRGTKCWNGPQRNVVLIWTCGTDNALLAVQELEKCEYQFTATSPALCLPPDAPESKREEL